VHSSSQTNVYLAVNYTFSCFLQFFFHSCNLCRLLVNCFLQLTVLFFQQINLSESTQHVTNYLNKLLNKYSKKYFLKTQVKFNDIFPAKQFTYIDQHSRSYPVNSSTLAIRSSFTMFNAFLQNTHCKYADRYQKKQLNYFFSTVKNYIKVLV